MIQCKYSLPCYLFSDNKLSAMSCCLLHIAYFFLVAVTATFLQISVPMRLAALTVIVGNVAAELNYNHSFDFAGLTVFLFLVYFGGYFLHLNNYVSCVVVLICMVFLSCGFHSMWFLFHVIILCMVLFHVTLFYVV